ncbi:MAG: PQQ-binding-like beta-propeller repeat protein [Planctomycetales bacterium]|nr:PQQ-binding-like beta-propeller repeat protein [Planctomycetales bacterium]
MQLYPSKFLLRATLVSVACGIAVASLVQAEEWPQWRGPFGTGVSGEKDLPISWNEQKGILWKVSLPGTGTSTPAVWGEAIFVTCLSADNKLLLAKFSRSDGQVVWQREVGTGEDSREGPRRSKLKVHQYYSVASPSPVTDGKTVVAHFGNGDLAAYDFDGNQLWKRNLQDDHGTYTCWYGHANSPVVFKNQVISACLQDSLADLQDKPAESYLVSHDLLTGKLRWKVSRNTQAKAEECDAYTTPLLTTLGTKEQLVVMGGNQLDSYDPANGKQLWFLSGLVGGRTVNSPTTNGEMIFAVRGLKKPLVAVRPSKSGELSPRDITWQYDEGSPDTCCPVIWNDLLFTVGDDGIARCIDVPTGHLQWKQRLKGGYKASPLAADGRIYFLSIDGLCTVISASPRFDKLLENKLDDETIASPAVSDKRIYIRGKKSLYCIGR